MYSPHGTPEQCANDHLHGVFKSRVHAELKEIAGDMKDLTKIPDAVSSRRGGPLLSEKGWRRGINFFMYALACSRVWARFEQRLLLCSFVRTGYYETHVAGEFLEMGFDREKTKDFMEKTKEELESALREGRRPFIHPAHDHTGQDPNNAYRCHQNFGTRPWRSLDKDGNLDAARVVAEKARGRHLNKGMRHR